MIIIMVVIVNKVKEMFELQPTWRRAAFIFKTLT